MAMFRILLLCAFWSIACLWAEAIPSELQKAIESFLDISSFRAELVQTNFVKMTSEEEVYNGEIFFDKDRLLIKYSSPSVQLVYSDKQETVVYLQESNQKMVSSPTLIFWPNKMVSKFLVGGRDFVRKVVGDKVFYEFVPDLQQSENVSKVAIGVKGVVVSSVKYYDFEGNFTHYEFFDLQFGEEIDRSLFEVTYPEGVEVIDNR